MLEEILVQEDETIEVGAELARIGDGSGAGSSEQAPAEEASAAEAEAPDQQAEPEPEQQTESEQAPAEESPAAEEQPQEAEQAPAEEKASAPEAPAQPQGEPERSEASVDVSGNAGYVTPLVRRLANQHGVDLSTVTGTGVGGRIRKEDVLAATQPRAGKSAERAPLEVSKLRGTSETMSRLRKVAAEQAVTSMQTTAQVTTVIEADVTKVAALIARRGSAFQEKTGTELDYVPFFAKAATEALQAFPVINAIVDGDQIVYPSRRTSASRWTPSAVC